MTSILLYRRLRARRALTLFNDVLFRTRRALSLYRLCTAIVAFWFSVEHLWTALTPFWLSTDDIFIHQTELHLTMTAEYHMEMKSFIAKRVNSILVNLRYLRFKLLIYKENNKKICNTFYHNFKNFFFVYIMQKQTIANSGVPV